MSSTFLRQRCLNSENILQRPTSAEQWFNYRQHSKSSNVERKTHESRRVAPFYDRNPRRRKRRRRRTSGRKKKYKYIYVHKYYIHLKAKENKKFRRLESLRNFLLNSNFVVIYSTRNKINPSVLEELIKVNR